MPLMLKLLPQTPLGSYLKLTGLPSLAELPQSWVWDASPTVSVQQRTLQTSSLALQIALFPKVNQFPKKHNTLGFNDECKTAIRTRNKALRKVKVSPTSANLDNYRILRS